VAAKGSAIERGALKYQEMLKIAQSGNVSVCTRPDLAKKAQPREI
jgi:hypothetical protein